MPTPLLVRRARGFQPCRYTERHRAVIRLLMEGKTRAQIAHATGYSVSHISRISQMAQARRDIAENIVAIFSAQVQDTARRLSRSRKRS